MVVCCRWARPSRAAFLWFGMPKFADRRALTLVDVQGCWRAAWACGYQVTAVPLRYAVVKATLCRPKGSCAASCRVALSVWEQVLRTPGSPTSAKYSDHQVSGQQGCGWDSSVGRCLGVGGCLGGCVGCHGGPIEPNAC